MKQFFTLILLFLIIVLCGCEKPPDLEPPSDIDKITVEIYPVDSVSYHEAYVRAYIVDRKSHFILIRGFRWRKDTESVWTKTSEGRINYNDFIYTIRNLDSGQRYIVEAWVQYNWTEVYSKQILVVTRTE